jgi:TolB protein
MSYSRYTPVAHIWSLPIPNRVPVSAYGGVQLTFEQEGIEGVTVSPDGKWLAFDSDRSGNYDVWKIPTTGGQPVQLTNDVTGDHVQSWSPTGDELAFHSFRNGNRDVFTMRADGTGVRQVTTSRDSEANPVWGPDGNTLVIQSSATGRDELYLWSRPHPDSAWAVRHPLTTEGGADPMVSPDGRWVAYVWGGALHVVSPDGTGKRVLVPPADPAARPAPAMPAWSRDSRSLFYMAYDDLRRGSIWRVPVTGGKPTLLVRFDDPTRPSLRRDLATDGTRLYFPIAQPASDIYLMEFATP